MNRRLVAVAGLLTVLTVEARADPVYSGSARAELTLTSISGGAASSLISLPLTNHNTSFSTTASGFVDGGTPGATATSTFMGSTPGPGDTITLESIVGGGVNGPRGNSNSIASSTGGLTISNTSGDTITLHFRFEYRYLVQAVTTGPTQSADASATVTLKATTNLGDMDANLSFKPAVIARNGTSQTSQSNGFPNPTTFEFIVALSPAEQATINLRADAIGSAAAAVPEPSSLAIVGTGLALGIVLSLRGRHPTGVRRAKAA